MNKKTIFNLLLAGILFLLPTQGLIAKVTLADQSYTVTSLTDQVVPVFGELRYFINLANANTVGTTTIFFNITGTGVKTINLISDLPVITKKVWFDGTTQAGYAPGSPMVVLNGGGIKTNGIVFNEAAASGSKVTGLEISGFTNDGVRISFADNCEVIDCVINRIGAKSLHLHTASYCKIFGNYINTNKALADTLTPRSEEGIFFNNNQVTGSTNNTIGDTACGKGNTIAYTNSEGIDNNPSAFQGLNVFNKISGNIIFNNRFNAILMRGSGNGGVPLPAVTSTGCTVSGTTVANGIVELFGSNSPDQKNALVFLKLVVANSSGNWSTTLKSIQYPYIGATATRSTGNTSELNIAVPITPTTLDFTSPSTNMCGGTAVNFTNTSTSCAGTTYMWDFGDGSALSSSPSHLFAPGTYTVKLYAQGTCPQRVTTRTITVTTCLPPPCETCIGSFAPDNDVEYIISAWVKKETGAVTDLTYTQPQIYVDFPSTTFGPFTAKGQIIDGWQRIEEKFTVPTTAANITLRLACTTGNCLFDDVRVFPIDGSMKSYVYDPVNLRLVAELDERNYATFYEYDEEGKLVRVKKETEKGTMTIKSNMNSSVKK